MSEGVLINIVMALVNLAMITINPTAKYIFMNWIAFGICSLVAYAIWRMEKS